MSDGDEQTPEQPEQPAHPWEGLLGHATIEPGSAIVSEDEQLVGMLRFSFATFGHHGIYMRTVARCITGAQLVADCEKGHPRDGLADVETTEVATLLPIAAVPAMITEMMNAYNAFILHEREQAAIRRARAQLN